MMRRTAVIGLLLSALIAREFHLRRHVVLKVLAAYVVSLAAGIAVVLVDEILR